MPETQIQILPAQPLHKEKSGLTQGLSQAVECARRVTEELGEERFVLLDDVMATVCCHDTETQKKNQRIGADSWLHDRFLWATCPSCIIISHSSYFQPEHPA